MLYFYLCFFFFILNSILSLKTISTLQGGGFNQSTYAYLAIKVFVNNSCLDATELQCLPPPKPACFVQTFRFKAGVQVEVNGEVYSGDHVLVAVGGRPVSPDIPGIHQCQGPVSPDIPGIHQCPGPVSPDIPGIHQYPGPVSPDIPGIHWYPGPVSPDNIVSKKTFWGRNHEFSIKYFFLL